MGSVEELFWIFKRTYPLELQTKNNKQSTNRSARNRYARFGVLPLISQSNPWSMSAEGVFSLSSCSPGNIKTEFRPSCFVRAFKGSYESHSNTAGNENPEKAYILKPR